MSIRIMSHVWDSEQFEGAALIMLLALADQANDQGWCWPSVETLQKKTRLAERTVYQTIKVLVDAGWVTKTLREGSKRVLYEVHPPALNAGETAPHAGRPPAPDAVNTAPHAVNTAPHAKPPHPLISRTVNEPSRTSPRGKRVRPSDLDLPKPRHNEFKELIRQCWQLKNPDVDMPWGPAEAGQLGNLLASSPGMTTEQFTRMLSNRFMSDVVHSERPCLWLNRITSYANGPIDRFNKHPQEQKQHGTTKTTDPDREAKLRAITNETLAQFERHPA